MSNQIEREFDAPKESVRLNKFLSEAGVCSRREADRLIESGRVTVDGRRAEMGMRVTKDQEVCVGKKVIQKKDRMVLLAVNYPTRITYIGRLDKDSEGLLLMTNNGDIINKMMRAGNCHEKEYKVTVNKEVTKEFVRKMSEGVPILDTVTRPCKVEKTGKYKFRIILTQGLNRQIRRMCEYFGYQVTRLERVRVMNIELGNLKSGEYREVTGRELDELYEQLKGSSNNTVYEEQ